MKPTLLIIDDEPAIRTLLESFLEERYACVSAGNAAEARAAIAEQYFNVVLSDIDLGGETGTELVCAESRLILFDLRAQKIIRIDQQRFRSYLPETRGVFASAAPRLRAPAAFDGEKTLPLRRSDIDFNGHVHNTKYLDFALEALPDTVPRDAFTGIRMVYPKAVKDVDAVTLKYTLTDTGPFVCVYSGDTLCTLIRFET